MYTSIGIDENGHPYVNTSGGNGEKAMREGKRKSIIDFPANYVVIYIETTGLDPRYCDIIELSAVRHAPGISECIQSFHDFIGDSVLVGYNVNFDINFLYDKLLQLHAIPLSNPFIDVIRIARKALPGLEDHKQSTAAEHYGISTAGAHRAAADCEICNSCFLRLRDEILSSGMTLGDFKKPLVHKEIHAKDIPTEKTSFDHSHSLFGKVCVFTGTLEKMPRKGAM